MLSLFMIVDYIELAVQLLQSVSPMVFSRAYARLTPLLQHRDFLAELPYELTGTRNVSESKSLVSMKSAQ
jgi:hypothetical protein